MSEGEQKKKGVVVELADRAHHMFRPLPDQIQGYLGIQGCHRWRPLGLELRIDELKETSLRANTRNKDWPVDQ
jgi:hypothetical protein